MAKTFIKNKPAINMTLVGFGQAGSRMVDEFAAYKGADGQSIYNCLALNSNDGDLQGLKHIPQANRESLNLGGLGKNPEKAIQVLEENVAVKEKLKSFIQKKIRPNDDLVLFFAGLGGGTGTATIVKAIEEFYEYNNKPKIAEELRKLQQSVDPAEFKANIKKYMRDAVKAAEEKFIKIGVVVTLPLRNDGPDVLRQVNAFAQQIWKIANDKTKGVAFVMFADNQHFYDEFKRLPENQRGGIDNYRDYANKQIAEIFHELNTAATGGGTSVILDSQDFRRIIMEHTGCLVISKVEMPMSEVTNTDNIKDLFKRSFKYCNFHQPIEIVKEEDGKLITKKVHHVGLLAILDEKKDIGSGFIEEAVELLHETLPINGSVFSGYLEEKNDFKASVYCFYKTEGLPERLSKGLLEEYKQFQERNQKFVYKTDTIQGIEKEDDEDFEIDLTEFGIEIEAEEVKETVPSDTTDEVNIDELLNDIDFSTED